MLEVAGSYEGGGNREKYLHYSWYLGSWSFVVKSREWSVGCCG